MKSSSLPIITSTHELAHDAELLAEVNKILAEIGMEYKGTTKVHHFAEVLYNEVGVEKIKEKVTKPLDYPVAAFYGCHFLKPSNIKNIDDPEDPKILDELIEATGAKSMPRKQKVLCCGAGGGLKAAFGDVAKKFTQTNLENITASGAKYIIDVCPFCHLQFDGTQKELGYAIPVLHLSQLLGLAMGMDEKELALSTHITPVQL